VRLHGLPVLSIVIPIFNTASTLERAIQSCATQNYTEFELVCVLDAPTDDSEAVLLALVDGWGEGVRIVRHETRKGLLLARRSGLLASRGRYIMSLDPDDIYLGNIFDSVVRTHRETGADVVQFRMMRSENYGRPRPYDYCGTRSGLFGNQELRQAVIEGGIMWNRVLLSVERGVNILAFEILSARFSVMLFQEEDRLQAYVIYYFARRFVSLVERGYFYFQIRSVYGPDQERTIRRDRENVREFLLSFYNVSRIEWHDK
jgi:glycosyltransferase involved in cell wall biosynthesis